MCASPSLLAPTVVLLTHRPGLGGSGHHGTSSTWCQQHSFALLSKSQCEMVLL